MRRLGRLARRLLAGLDALMTRLYGWEWNPILQTGTVAVAMLLVLLATGLYLVVFYRVGSPAESVARLAADPWLGSWLRTLHRYASDLFIVAAVLHALRIFAQGRTWGPRTLAWVSGLFLFGAGLICAWTGYVMAWDTFGERLALEGGRLLDALPILSEPVSRIFAGETPVPDAFFFINLFIHIALPLGLGAGLWLHVSRLGRPVLLPPRPLLWTITGAITLLSVIMPAALGPPADPGRLAPSTPVDLVAAWWLPLSEHIPAGLAWTAAVAAALTALLVPRLTRRAREGRWAPSWADPRLCTGCNQCPQDCPWDAITMVGRDDDRPELVARVDPSRCVSCGVCAGSCAPMGVGPPGRTGRDQLSRVRELDLPAPGADPLPIVALCCEQAPPAQVAALRERGAQVHLVPCVGNVHTSVVELYLRLGAPGVWVGGCPPRDCQGREGPKWLHARLFDGREAELQPRVDRRRIATATLAPGSLADTVAAFEAFARGLPALAPIDAGADLAPDTECEPVPLKGGAT